MIQASFIAGPAGQQIVRYLVNPDTPTAEIQKVLNTAPPGARVEFATGTFTLTDNLKITRGDITVVGQGSDKTHFIFAPSDGVPDGAAIGVTGGAMPKIGVLSQTAAADSNVIHMAGNHGVKTGDFLFLREANTPAYLDSIGDKYFRRTGDAPQREVLVEVVGVQGDKIILKNPLGVAFDGNATDVQKTDLLKNVELGGFSLEYNLGTPDPYYLGNTVKGLPNESQLSVAAVALTRTYGAQVDDISLKNVASTGYSFLHDLEAKVSNISVDGSHNKGGGGHGYAYLVRETYYGDFSNLSDANMRHSLTFSGWDSEANNKFYIKSTDRDINFHGGQDYNNTVVVEKAVGDIFWYESLFANKAGTFYGAPTDMSKNKVAFKYLVSDKIIDTVAAADGGAIISTGRKDDVVTTGSGNDWFDLGADKDTVVFHGASNRYDVSKAKDARGEFLVVKDRTGADGTDKIYNVEFLQFADKKVAVADVVPGGLAPAPVAPPPPPPPSAGATPPGAPGAGGGSPLPPSAGHPTPEPPAVPPASPPAPEPPPPAAPGPVAPARPGAFPVTFSDGAVEGDTAVNATLGKDYQVLTHRDLDPAYQGIDPKITVVSKSENSIGFKLDSAWGGVDKIQVHHDGSLTLGAARFVEVDLALKGDGPSKVIVDMAARGSIATGAGADDVSVKANNDAAGDNTFTIDTGGGDDKIDALGRRNATSVEIDSGDGADKINVNGMLATTVKSGAGADEVKVTGWTPAGETRIETGAGNDRITLEALGTSKVDAGAGDDVLVFGKSPAPGGASQASSIEAWGGEGADTFVFHNLARDVTIQDFERGVDKLDIRDFGVTDAATLSHVTAQAGADGLHIQVSPSTTIHLAGYKGPLAPDMFVLSGDT